MGIKGNKEVDKAAKKQQICQELRDIWNKFNIQGVKKNTTGKNYEMKDNEVS